MMHSAHELAEARAHEDEIEVERIVAIAEFPFPRAGAVEHITPRTGRMSEPHLWDR